MNPAGQLWGEYADAGRSFSRAARLCLAAGFLVWLGRGIQGVLFNLYLVAGGFEEAFVGQALGMAGLGLATAAIPAGLLADRLGRRRCLMLGALVEAAGALGRACLLHPSGILAASFVLGAGQSLFTVAALPYLTEHSTPRERTHLFSAVLSVNLLAWVVGSAAGGVLPSALRAALGDTLVGEPIAYRGVLVLAALCATAAWVPLALLRGLTERSTPSQRTGELRDSARRLAPIALNFLLIGCGAGLVVPFMNLYFKDRFGCSTAQIGAFFSVAAIVTALASLCAPLLARRLGTLRTALLFELLSLPFLLTLGMETALATAVAAYWLRTMLMNAGTPLLHSFMMSSLPPRLHSRSSSVVTLVWNIGWASSAAGAGVLIQRWGFATPFFLAAGLYAAASFTFYLSFRRLPQPPSQPALTAAGLES